jgi:hypothetical protein
VEFLEVRPIMITTYERGKMAGRLESALLQLEAKFGALPPEIKQRVEALSPEELRELQINLLKAESLKELRLEG